MGYFRIGMAVVIGFAALAPLQAARFLFDNTKAETAGNADWVIDEDANVASRVPTPAASGITPATPENYWLGALSSWGVALVRRGHAVETLPSGGRITYQDAANAQDLSRYDVFVVCEPNILFTAAEKTAIVRYVLEGGRLFLVADHTGSDRNNDGADSVRVWNDLIDTNSEKPDPFGFCYNVNNVSLTSSLVDADASDPIVHGPVGEVTGLKYSAGATMTIHPATADVRAAVWRTAGSNSDAMAVYGRAGQGGFVAIGDSSPVDDGTGAPGNTLYYGWTELASHAFLAMNGSLWLADGFAPRNDAFANAVVVANPDGRVAFVGSNLQGTRETGEPALAGSAGGKSVWWRFTAPTSGTVTVSTAGSGFDTTLGVYTGDQVDSLAEIAENDDVTSGDPTSAVAFPVVEGRTYSVAVDGRGGAAGPIALAFQFPIPPPPSNDNFAAAAPVAPEGASVTATNARATREAGEPVHASRVGGASVWWSWTAPVGTQSVTVSTFGSAIDTNLAVYVGDRVDALTLVAQDTGSAGTTAGSTRFAVTPGASYRIAVDGEAGAMGGISLAVIPSAAAPARPANDALVDALVLTGTSPTASQSNDQATAEAGEPAHAGNPTEIRLVAMDRAGHRLHRRLDRRQ